MEYDISQSISQGNYGANASQSGRMEEVADKRGTGSGKNEAESHPWTAY